MRKKTIQDIDVQGKKVLVRCDFNVPLNEKGKITDDTRIKAAIPTIKNLMDRGAKVILCSHLGRPKGEVKKELSLQPVADELTYLLNTDVKFADDITGESAKTITSHLEDGEVALLENLRFDPREEKNDDTLSLELANLSDGIYVNDAFGTAHRAHSSTEGVTRVKQEETNEPVIKEAVAGLLMEKELEFLGGTLENPEKPFVAILGGAKVSDKIGVIENLLDKVDEILIGGGMAFTFLKAKGYNIGNSICEEDKVKEAKSIMDKAKQAGVKITLPKDVRVAQEFSNAAPDKLVDSDKIPDGYQGMDIGPKTFMDFANEIKQAKTIVWNGPLGVCEFDNYAIGTEKVAEAVAANDTAISVIGGGDSVAAIKKLSNKFPELQIDTKPNIHLSTGGGASLEFLEGKELPGVACLTDKTPRKLNREPSQKREELSKKDEKLR